MKAWTDAWRKSHPGEKLNQDVKPPDWEFAGDEYIAFDAFVQKKLTGVQPTYDEMIARDLEWDAEVNAMQPVWDWVILGR